MQRPQKNAPLNVGRISGFWSQHHFISWIISEGVFPGIRSSAGRSPFLTHWHIWSSLLASEHRHNIYFGSLEVAFVVKRLFLCYLFSISAHVHRALPLWGRPKPQLQSRRRQTSRWRLYVYSPGAQGPCSSVCRHLSPQLIAPYDSSCETPPLSACSMFGIWPGRGLQSRWERKTKYADATYTLPD